MAALPELKPTNPETEEPPTGDAWWALFEELRLMRAGEFDKHGGPVAWIRKLRESDSID